MKARTPKYEYKRVEINTLRRIKVYNYEIPIQDMIRDLRLLKGNKIRSIDIGLDPNKNREIIIIETEQK